MDDNTSNETEGVGAGGELLTHRAGEAWADELSLTRLADGRIAAAWVDRDDDGERICLREVRDDGLGPVRTLEAPGGHPSAPQACSGRVAWAAMGEARGTLTECRLDAELNGADTARPIEALGEANVGHFALCDDGDGGAWLAAQVYECDITILALLHDAGDGWRRVGRFAEAPCYRPTLHRADGEVRAAWDVYRDGYRTLVATAGDDGLTNVRELPADEGTWEYLPALSGGGDGRWYAARCREWLVDLDGAVNHHSELVVAVDGEHGWRDVASVDIDFAMNPWLAAYWGYRRFPNLIVGDDGVRLLWEEKLDGWSMDPSPGRLCGLPVSEAGPTGRPGVLVSDHCMFVPIADGRGRVLAASKTQPHAWDWRLPWRIHRVRLDVSLPPRPTGLESNRDAPVYTVRVANPDVESRNGERKLLFGDAHAHSRYSADLDGELDELYHFARDVAWLDFISITDNDGTRFTEPMPPDWWEHIRRAADHHNEPGRFTALLGWEYTLHRAPGKPNSRDNHRTILYPGDEGEILSWADDTAATPADLVRLLRPTRCLVHFHHAGHWELSDPELERNAELVSGWRNCMRDSRFDFEGELNAALGGGHRLGFFGASDNHERNPGLGGAVTGLWAEENTREAIFEAFRERRCFATTGLRPVLEFSVAGAPMGGEAGAEKPLVQARVECDVPVTRLRLVRDGETVAEQPFHDRRVEWEWTDDDCPPGEHYYYLHVSFDRAGKAMPWNLAPPFGGDAWTSPVWIARP